MTEVAPYWTQVSQCRSFHHTEQHLAILLSLALLLYVQLSGDWPVTSSYFAHLCSGYCLDSVYSFQQKGSLCGSCVYISVTLALLLN